MLLTPHIPANWTFLPSSRSRTSLQKAESYIPENDTTGKGIIGEDALRLPFVMFGDRVSARSLTALSR
jgi:hypothetical protein